MITDKKNIDLLVTSELVIFVFNENFTDKQGNIGTVAYSTSDEDIATRLFNNRDMLFIEFFSKCYTTGNKTFDKMLQQEVHEFLKL